MGPYAAMSINTRKSDVAEVATDNKISGFAWVIIALLLLGPSACVVVFIGLFALAHIGLIVTTGIIGLAIWACGHYGTKRSILDRFRYRTTAARQDRITKRLSAIRIARRLSDIH